MLNNKPRFVSPLLFAMVLTLGCASRPVLNSPSAYTAMTCEDLKKEAALLTEHIADHDSAMKISGFAAILGAIGGAAATRSGRPVQQAEFQSRTNEALDKTGDSEEEVKALQKRAAYLDRVRTSKGCWP